MSRPSADSVGSRWSRSRHYRNRRSSRIRNAADLLSTLYSVLPPRVGGRFRAAVFWYPSGELSQDFFPELIFPGSTSPALKDSILSAISEKVGRASATAFVHTAIKSVRDGTWIDSIHHDFGVPPSIRRRRNVRAIENYDFARLRHAGSLAPSTIFVAHSMRASADQGKCTHFIKWNL